MKLRNFLSFPDTEIACFLRDRGFDYGTDANDNFIWQYIIDVNAAHVFYIIINCDLNNCKLNLNREVYINGIRERDSEEINIPKEIIEKDNIRNFIDWLDETCEPYFN